MSTGIGNGEFFRALGLSLAALGVSAVTLLAVYLLLVPVVHPEFKPHIANQNVARVSLPGQSFRPVVFGSGGIEGSTAVISALATLPPEDHAVLMIQRRLQADNFPFFRYHIEGRNPALRVMLFWQRTDTPGESHFVELDSTGEGPQLHNLLRHQAWRGTITELAIGFFGDLRGKSVRLHEVQLEPYSHRGLLRVIWAEWTAFAPWDQSSINVYPGVPENSLLYPVPIAAVWLAMAILFLLALRKIRRNAAQAQVKLTAAIVALMIWCVLDGLWLIRLYQQNIETQYLFAGKTLHEKKLADWDGDYYAFGQSVKAHLPANTKISVLYTERELLPLAQRLRLHLLPEHRTDNIRLFSREDMPVSQQENCYLIVLGEPMETDQARRFISRPGAITPPGKLELIYSDTVGNLYLLCEDRREGKP